MIKYDKKVRHNDGQNVNSLLTLTLCHWGHIRRMVEGKNAEKKEKNQ